MKWYQFWKKPWWPWNKTRTTQTMKILHALTVMKTGEDYEVIQKSIKKITPHFDRISLFDRLGIAAFSEAGRFVTIFLPLLVGFASGEIFIIQASEFLQSFWANITGIAFGFLMVIPSFIAVRKFGISNGEKSCSAFSHASPKLQELLINFINDHEYLETGPKSPIAKYISEIQGLIWQHTADRTELVKISVTHEQESIQVIDAILNGFNAKLASAQAQHSKLKQFFTVCRTACAPLVTIEMRMAIDARTRAGARRLEELNIEVPVLLHQSIQRFAASMCRLNAALTRISELSNPAEQNQHDTIITEIDGLQNTLTSNTPPISSPKAEDFDRPIVPT